MLPLLNSSPPSVGEDMYQLMKKLFPLCRSITGNGVRQTFSLLQESLPLTLSEVPTGTSAYDWTVPNEWNISDAYIKDSQGNRIIDFQQNNLHVLGYSTPVHKTVSKDELLKHVYTLPNYPDWIPYLTTYYKERWGFCMSENQKNLLKDHTYEVCINSTLQPGSLTYGEYVVPGKTQSEILLSCYTCHPSMCNDNLSGIVLLTELAKFITQYKKSLHYTYRFLFIPETIGSLVWLSQNEDILDRIYGGLVATCVGDSGSMTYKKSRRGNTEIDKIAQKILEDSPFEHAICDFFPTGSDERQFCSPGFNLPIGSIFRSQYLTFPEYHTSADNLDFVQGQYLRESFEVYKNVIFALENNKTYLNTNPKGEPQLGKRGLYQLIGGKKNAYVNQHALLWVLNFSDGSHSLLDIAQKSGFSFTDIYTASQALVKCNLLTTDF